MKQILIRKPSVDITLKRVGDISCSLVVNMNDYVNDEQD